MGVFFEILGERWLGIPGFPYEISDLGRLRGFNHRRGLPGLVKPHPDKEGYLMYSLSLNGKCFWKKAHRLVGIAYIKNPLNLPQINHIDGDKTNNKVSNLEWCNNSQNQIHRRDVLRKTATGENHFAAKLTQNQADSLRAEYKTMNMTMKQIGCKYGITAGVVHAIVHNKRYVRHHF